MPTQHLGVTGGSIAQDVPYTNTVASMIETMLVDSSNKMERFLTAQRIRRFQTSCMCGIVCLEGGGREAEHHLLQRTSL